MQGGLVRKRRLSEDVAEHLERMIRDRTSRAATGCRPSAT